MNKEDIMKIAIFVLAAIMMGGMFYGIQFNQQNKTTVQGTVASGGAEFNGTLRTYEPFLAVGSNVSDSVIAELRGDDRVKSVTSEAGGYLINTTTRDDVFQVAEYLSGKGISSDTIADVIMPSYIQVKFANGSSVNASTAMLGSVRVMAEPLVDIDSDVSVKMIAIVQGDTLVSYSSATLVSTDVSLPANATIVSLAGKRYGFTIPWSERAKIDAKSLGARYGAGNVEYGRNDYISFPGGLTISQIAEKKGLPYITFISDTGASVEENFSDEAQVASDFGNTTVAFPDSSLGIVTNSSVDLGYNGTGLYSYIAALPQQLGDYSMAAGTISFDAYKEYGVNDTAMIIVNGTAIGNRIVKINAIGAG